MSDRIKWCKSKSEEILSEKKLSERKNKENPCENFTKKFDNKKKLRDEEAKAHDVKKLLEQMSVTKSTQCGFWFMKGKFFQRFANQTSYVVIAGIVGCIFNSTFSYFNGTMTTMEKRFKIPSRNSGIIYVGYDTSTLLIASWLCYYAGRGHRPRWIGFGLSTICIFCLLMALPHFIYGPGESALALTAEFGAKLQANETKKLVEQEDAKSLCQRKISGECTAEEEGNFTPQIVFFVAELIAGVGGSLFDSLGSTYMDDNTEKSRAPVMLSICIFLRMLGPVVGYTLASICVGLYIAPHLQPVISTEDPRWLGAWWLGWLIIGGLLCLSGIFLAMFPKHLPQALARRIIEKERKDASNPSKQTTKLETIKEEQESFELLGNLSQRIAAVEALDSKASLQDMLKTFKELIRNKTFMFNNCSSIFYCFGYTPYWIFTAKYIEMQYRQSAATASMVTGMTGFAFSAVGVLSAGVVISRFKPSARQMAAWNILVTSLTFFGIISYAFVGCDVNDSTMMVNLPVNNTTTCNSACDCDYVQYSPVCGENGMTYISPCHAGCKRQITNAEEKQVYYDCACIPNSKGDNETFVDVLPSGGQALSGACPVDCVFQFIVFIVILSSLKFLSATAQASSFLLNMRCVPEKDKSTSVGFGMMLMCLLVFIPGPIFFGWLLDCLCLVWGKTCSSEGNCWLYDSRLLRYVLNFTAASFFGIGSIFDIGVWYLVRDLQIFDEEDVTKAKVETIQIPENFIMSLKKRNSF